MSEEWPVDEVVVEGFAATPEGTKDLLLSCPCDAEGAVLRVPLVEEDVDVHTEREMCPWAISIMFW
jgi:stress response protein YsnF